MGDLWTTIADQVINALVVFAAGGLLAWLRQTYKRFREIVKAIGDLLTEQKTTNTLLGGIKDRVDEHEARIETLERKTEGS